MEEVAIRVEGVGKTFKLPHEKQGSIKNVFVGAFRKKRTFEKQQVLNNISFDIKKGEFFGIVGRNGSGKSTLLKLLAGVYSPNGGQITVNGKLTPFIELGVGFNPELSGRENVFLNGALLGFNRKEMLAMYDEIVAFAELEKFMDQKLKNYSSGMQVRLAFSIAIRAKSDILLLDEVLAVGDAIFQKKCYDYFKQLKKEKRTVVFVSHDTGALQEYCTSGILLEKGNIIQSGPISDIVKNYLDVLNKTEGATLETNQKKKRWGTGHIVIENTLVSKNDSPTNLFTEDDDITIETIFKANSNIEQPVYGMTISDLSGQIVFQSNTLWCKKPVEDLKAGDTVTVQWVVPNVFNTGTYVLSPGCADKSGSEIFDWIDEASKFKVQKKQKSHGIINADHELNILHEKNFKK